MQRLKYISDLVTETEKNGGSLADVVWRQEANEQDCPPEAVWAEMGLRLATIRQAAATGLRQEDKSFSGLSGGDAKRMTEARGLLGSVAGRALTYALSVSEVNAKMGKIVACPTAGSCGIVPGALLATAEFLGCDDAVLIRGLFTAAGIGMVIDANATVAGAVGGCQAECGSAAAMAAGAVTEMMGGSPRQAVQALALALKNMLGLVCDPVAGLVEVPCVKRNGFAAVHALVAAEMALAGVESVIPADEVIAAMYQIGLALPRSLKETSEAGLAKTPAGVAITERLL